MQYRKVVEFYDVSPRESHQAPGYILQLDGMISIISLLDQVGVDVIELGWPGTNHTWDSLFEEIKSDRLVPTRSKFATFGATRHPTKSVKEDNLLQKVLAAPTGIITLFGKACLEQVSEALGTSPENNIDMVRESMQAIVERDKRAIFDAEHFFRAFRRGNDSREYALEVLAAAVEGGASTLCLCDTTGGLLPHQVGEIIPEVIRLFGASAAIGVHLHNDNGMANANTLEAIRHGVQHVQTTVNGYGERAGMADSINILANLDMSNPELTNDLDLDVLRELSESGHRLAGLHPDDRQPFTGRATQYHKAGVHMSAIFKGSSWNLYEEIPISYGRSRHVALTPMSGRTGVRLFASLELGINPDRITEQIANEVLQEIEQKTDVGYAFDFAGASACLVIATHLWPDHKPSLECFRGQVVSSLGDSNEDDEAAWLTVMHSSTLTTVASEGDGPVDALFRAICKALPENHPAKSLQLLDFQDYKLPGGDSNAAIRIQIDWASPEHFTTQGVSRSILKASFEAILDAISYAELRHNLTIGKLT